MTFVAVCPSIGHHWDPQFKPTCARTRGISIYGTTSLYVNKRELNPAVKGASRLTWGATSLRICASLPQAQSKGYNLGAAVIYLATHFLPLNIANR
jgi:hypothetical protein